LSVVVRLEIAPFVENEICMRLFSSPTVPVWPGSSVGVVTGYGLHGPGIESWWGRDLPHLSRAALRPTEPLIQWVPGFPSGKERPGCDADPSPPSSAVVMKE
jgi:hypothetical protein